MGLGMMALGIPFYFFWKSRADTTLFREKTKLDL